MVTAVPGAPIVGVKLAIVGAPSAPLVVTVKGAPVVAEVEPTVTEIGPVVAPVGTVTTSGSFDIFIAIGLVGARRAVPLRQGNLQSFRMAIEKANDPLVGLWRRKLP